MNKQTELVMENEKLVYWIIAKYSQYFDKDDLYQVGIIGLIKASKNYKDDKKTKFSTYAYTYILGEVLKYIKDSKIMKIGREYCSLSKKINEAKILLTQKLMKEPSTYEIALFLEEDERIIEDVINSTQMVDSIDRAITEDGKTLFIEDRIKSNKEENNIDYLLLHQEIEKLSINEQQILKARYFENRTQTEVANLLGVNQVQISREETKILKKMRQNYQNMEKI